jgi:hypothetical protein
MPRLRTILHFLHIGFTLARTFMNLSQTSNYSPPGQIVRSHFYNHFIAWQNPNLIYSQFPSDMSQNYLARLNLHTKNSIG